MPSPTFSITWSPRLMQALERRVFAERMRGSRSGTVAELVARYEEIATRCCPKLTDSEWNFLGMLFERTQFDAVTIDGLAAMVRRPLLPGDRLRQWGVDPEHLGRKLDKVDYAGRLAVVDRLEREASLREEQKRRRKR